MDRWTNLSAALLLTVSLAIPTLHADEFTTAADSAIYNRLSQLEAEVAALQSAPANRQSVGEDYFETPSTGGAFGGVELTLLAPQVGTLAASGTLMGNPLGTIQLTPKYSSFAAARIWGGYRNSQGLGMRIRYWDFDAQATGDFGGIPIDTTQSALALDGEVTQVMQVGLYELDASLGLRYGEIGRQALFPIAGFSQNFEGLGPTAALWARRPLGDSNFSLVGGGRVSLLFGDNDYTFAIDATQQALPLDAEFTLTSQHAALMVYELQGGLEWSRITTNNHRMFFRVQGEAQIWQVPPALFGLLANTTGFVGVSGALGLDW